MDFMNKIFLTIVLVVGLLSLGICQTTEKYSDKVILKNGSIIYGQLINYQMGSDIVLQLKSGQKLTFPESYISRVEMSGDFIEKPKIPQEYKLQDNKIYNTINLKLIPASQNLYNQNKTGVGLDYCFGYRYNHLLSAGIGIGFDNYNFGFSEYFVPVFVDMFSIFMKKTKSPFARVQLGYSSVFCDYQYISDYSGGVMFNGGLGFKFQGSNKIDYLIEMSYRYQPANFIIDNGGRNIQNYDIKFKKIIVKFGIMF